MYGIVGNLWRTRSIYPGTKQRIVLKNTSSFANHIRFRVRGLKISWVPESVWLTLIPGFKTHSSMPRFDHTLWHEASLQEKWWTWTESLAFLCWEKSNTNWFAITAQSCRHEPQSSHGHKSLLIAGFTRVNSLDHSPWDNAHHLIHLILSKMLQLHTPHNVGKPDTERYVYSSLEDFDKSKQSECSCDCVP